MGGAESADAQFVGTLRDVEHRAGRYVELDRYRFTPALEGGRLRIFSGENLALAGPQPDRPCTLSVRGRFRTPEVLEVAEYHVHWPFFRDAASGLGLLALLLVIVERGRQHGTLTVRTNGKNDPMRSG